MLAQFFAEGFPVFHALASELKATLTCTNQSHTVVHATGSQTALGNLKSPALAEQQVLCRHADIGERHLGMPNRCIVVTERGQRSQYLNARRVFGHKNLGLLQVSVRVLGIALAHHDKYFAALVGRTGDEPFMAIQYPLVAVTADIELDIGRIA